MNIIQISNPQYVRNLNLGYSIPQDRMSVPVSHILAAGINGVTTPEILDTIARLYVLVNGADDNVRATLNQMIIPADQITPTYLELFSDPSTALRLNQELNLLLNVAETYRYIPGVLPNN